MKISPISFGMGQSEKKLSVEHNDIMPTTVRHNSLSDMEFNIVADAIRCQNLKSQMNVRLSALKRNLNNCMARSTYNV